jgi:M6 family metalloprotease-like protein
LGNEFFLRKIIAALVTLSFLLLPNSASAATPKVGAKCLKLNQTQSNKGSTFTCVKSGKKLVWKSAGKKVASTAKTSVDFSKTFSTDNGYHTLFSGPCDLDPNIPAELSAIQKYFHDLNNCAGQLQIAKYTLGSKRPITTFDSVSKYANLQSCKLLTPDGIKGNLGQGFVNSVRESAEYYNVYPAPKTVIQLIPIYSTDTAQPSKSPAEDYKVFTDFFRDWIAYSSDFGSDVTVRVPSSYIKMPTPLAGYGLDHAQNPNDPKKVEFNRDLIAAVDPVIDFTGVNMAIVVPPAGTNSVLFGQTGTGGLRTNEGRVPNVMSEYAAFAKDPKASYYAILAHPFWWIHEMFHAGIGFDDHYGDGKRNVSTEYGMGHLTLMTPWGGDLTTWEKWRLGFIQDSQVQCKTDSASSTHWIAPSTVQTQQSKAVIIPISQTKVVVIETLRPGGLFYKHPLQSQGALVYEVDLMQQEHGMGMKLSLPIGRTIDSHPVFMASAPLKQGESTITNGYKITVLEAGTFGDVVKIEKS